MILWFYTLIPALWANWIAPEPICPNIQKWQKYSHISYPGNESHLCLVLCLDVCLFCFVLGFFCCQGQFPESSLHRSKILSDILGHICFALISRCSPTVSGDGSVSNEDVLKHRKQAWLPEKIVCLFDSQMLKGQRGTTTKWKPKRAEILNMELWKEVRLMSYLAFTGLNLV